MSSQLEKQQQVTTSNNNNNNINDLENEYNLLCEAEKKIDDELSFLLGNQPKLDLKLNSLKNILPSIQMIYKDSKNLSNMIDFTATLADNVSSKVRQLDLAKSRVLACSQRVTDILDLKACTDGVKEALAEEDYETAAGHIHRYLSMDKASLRFNNTGSDNTENNSLDQAFQLLQEAETKLRHIVDERYDAAVNSGDIPQAERFFKIFPLIGQHEAGLVKFSTYLCAQVTDAASKNLLLALNTDKTDKRYNIIFADTLIVLFETIARLIEAHQPLVETYYGHGRMFSFIKNIQHECDKQVVRILGEFRRIRKIDALFRIIQQSMNNPLSNTGSNTTNLSDKIDPRDLDVLLAEITLINARCELYLNFIRKRIISDIELNFSNKETTNELTNLLNEQKSNVESFISHCSLSCSIQELIGQYTIFEHYFMVENINKAISMDMIMNDSLTSSIVDDVFFILKKCVRRSLSSGSVDGCCAMLNHSVSILDSNYKEALYSKLKVGYPSGFDLSQAYNVLQSSIQQGRLQSSDHIEKQKLYFLMALNNIEATNNYIYALKKLFEDEIGKLFSQASKQASAKLHTCLNDLTAVATRFKALLDYGFNQLNTNAIKPRVKQWIEAYNSVNHKINEEEFMNYEANDPFIMNFIKNIDQLLLQLKDSLAQSNYDVLVGVTTMEIVVTFEKVIFKCSFSKYGGLLLDKEIRSLVNYLTSLTTWSIRERFSRLQQIATLLSLDNLNELFDYWDTSTNITWRLTPNEVRQVLALRIDFKQDEIKKLKL